MATTGTVLRTAATAAGLVLASSAFAADESAPVQKPDVKVGDSWTYRGTNLSTNVPRSGTGVTRVVFVSPDVIGVVNSQSDGRETDSQFGPDWSINSLGHLGEVFDPPIRMMKFPLRVGDTYPLAYQLVSKQGTPFRSKTEGVVTVVGWQDVTVPAGKFRALKIEAKGNYVRLDARGGAWQRWEVWYVPEVKRVVKNIYEEGQPGNSAPDLKTQGELLEFKLQ